jgi:hypothetical protein
MGLRQSQARLPATYDSQININISEIQKGLSTY